MSLDLEGTFKEWMTCVNLLILFHKAERKHELLYGRRRYFDKAGLHEESYLVGKIFAFEVVYPELKALRFDHLNVKALARNEAQKEYLKEKLAELQADKENDATEGEGN